MRASITMLAPLPRSRLALVLEAGAKHAAALQEVPTGAKLKSKETLERAKARRLEREKAQKQIKKLLPPRKQKRIEKLLPPRKQKQIEKLLSPRRQKLLKRRLLQLFRSCQQEEQSQFQKPREIKERSF